VGVIPDEQDERWRKYVDGKVQGAISDALVDVQRDVATLMRAFFGDPFDSEDSGLVGDVKAIKRMIGGAIDENGDPVLGLAQKVVSALTLKRWFFVIVGLIGTIALEEGVRLVLDLIFGNLTGHHGR
jgi:hypothetical protein